jgi:hypothetical protein
MKSATASASPFAGIIEYFTLQRARTVHAKLNEPARQQLARNIALGRQRSDAADTLWANGHSVEGLRLATAALQAGLDAMSTYAEGMKLAVAIAPAPVTLSSDETDGDVPNPENADDLLDSGPSEQETRALVLRDRHASARDIESIEQAITSMRGLSLPEFDTDVTPTQSAIYQQTMHAHRAVDRLLGSAHWSSREIKVTRASRVIGSLILTIAVVATVYLVTRKPEYTVHASAVWANVADHDQDKALDDRTDTWWLLPDGQPGWLEVRFTSPRHIEHVRLLNTTNAPHQDRGTNEYRIEFYSNGRIVHTVDDTFAFTPNPDWVAHSVRLDDIERIRFVVESHHRQSAGLTELDWD